MTTPTYQQLIAQGVPPDQAAQLIYDNLKKQPQPVVSPTASRVQMAQQSPEGPRGRGRPLNPLSRHRVLCSVILAQAYRSSSEKHLTLDQIHELMSEVYRQAGEEPKLPSLSSLQGALSKLRQGRVKGFPPVDTRGPSERMWDGRRQHVVVVKPRNKEEDVRKNLVRLELIPKWVIS